MEFDRDVKGKKKSLYIPVITFLKWLVTKYSALSVSNQSESSVQQSRWKIRGAHKASAAVAIETEKLWAEVSFGFLTGAVLSAGPLFPLAFCSLSDNSQIHTHTYMCLLPTGNYIVIH